MWGKALEKIRQDQLVTVPWELGIQPQRGHLVVVLGTAGVGKSAFGLNWVIDQPEPGVIVSLDTDLTTQASRAAAIMSGVPIDRVNHDAALWGRYLDRRLKHVKIYDLVLRPREILDLVKANTQYWGIAPAITVVDNLSNLLTSDMDFTSVRRTFIELHKVARQGNTCVVALHHARRGFKGGVPTQSGGEFGGEQEAEIVLGLGDVKGSNLTVGVLKNRNGPVGGSHPLTFEMPTMRIRTPDAGEMALHTLTGHLT